ncbi:DUF4440 domain-containing protein [Solibacillus sp. FSL W8-0474]|uniref:nuclear transport factor 2 family protein n=1 Tax=Solibacillus sp. FSL W8-0474 TaxID=2975336 RepID=UPI0030F62CF2
MKSIKEQFLQLEQQLMLYRKHDFIAFLSEDFKEFGSSGGIMDKKFLLENVTEQGINEIYYDVTDFEALLLTDDIVQTRFITTNLTNGKQQNRSSLWRNENGTWRIFFHQGTPAAN